MNRLRLIYPTQLFWEAIEASPQSTVYLLDDIWFYEGKEEWEIRPHRKKMLLLKAAVLSFQRRCEEAGVKLVRISSICELPSSIESIDAFRLGDDFVERELAEYCERQDINIHWGDSPGFVTPYAWGENFFSDGKKPFMKVFYEAQRKRMQLLLDDAGKPEGGKWSFDEDNRKKLPKKVSIPQSPNIGINDDRSALLDAARDELISSGQWEKGSGDGEGFRYPINHKEAQQWLEIFLVERFHGFGTYEDALSGRGDFLYHSVLTPMLNIGLLTPQYVVDRAIVYAGQHDVPLNDLEGFVRQIIGWREFIAIIYRRHGRWMRNQNFWGFDEVIPKAIWNRSTGLEPIDYVLEKVHREGYAHHIERLMVLGNFFMLMRIEPHAVYRWFMEMFVDAFDWVMVPNVYGMSQYASGGFMVTKPYLSGSNYLKKMSDFPAGEWCRVWDALYWSFIDDHRDFFASQYRMKMMLGHLDRMGAEKLAEHHSLAKAFRKSMREGKRWQGDSLF